MQTLVISYFCDVDGRTYYTDHAKRFKEECESFGIPYSIDHLESQGSYQNNCLIKPKFIYKKLIEKQRPILWLDIDTFILKEPSIFDGFSSLGVNIGVASTDAKELRQIKASPLWFNYNSETLEFIQMWIKQCDVVRQTQSNLFDHETFIACMTNYIKEKKIAILNRDYCEWPGKQSNSTVFMMGLSDMPSKKEVLKKMGYTDQLIEWQSPGNSFMAESR